MAFGLLIVGDEILSGKRVDKHVPKVIELLAARGLALSWVRYVGDDPRRITADLVDAFASGDIVFSCGGIGATPDDHTRQCAARALDVPLQLHPVARDSIHERLREMATEQGVPFDPHSADNRQRLNMGMFPRGAQIIPNPYNKIAGFFMQRASVEVADATACVAPVSAVFFVPGFPVMAWPMIEWVLDTHCAHLHRAQGQREQSVIVMGTMEAVLTPLMERIEQQHPAIKVFSLPSVDHPQWGGHIELGVKGDGAQVVAAYQALLHGLREQGATLGPELVR
jgi:molybdopterin-biosynthesis enzyme MoeA-like protein